MGLPRLQADDAIMVVDVQNDFCGSGSLPVPGADEIIGVLNQWIASAVQAGALVLASRDWHPLDHVSFREQGGPWPIHCVQGSHGAEFHPELRLPSSTKIISKATARNRESYSDFEGTGLAQELTCLGVRRLWIGGLALEYCVAATIRDGLAAGFEMHLILSATRALEIQPGDAARTLNELKALGCLFEPADL